MEGQNNQLKTIFVIAVIAFIVYLIFTGVNNEKYEGGDERGDRKCDYFPWRNLTCRRCVDRGKKIDKNLVIYCGPEDLYADDL